MLLIFVLVVCLALRADCLLLQNNIEPSSKESRKRAFERINLFKQAFKISDDG